MIRVKLCRCHCALQVCLALLLLVGFPDSPVAQSRTERIAEPTGNLLAPPLPDKRQSAQGEPSDPAEELWQKVLAAKGGLDALRAVRTSDTKSEVTRITPQETLAGTAEEWVEYPDKICRRWNIGGQIYFRTLVDTTLWLLNPVGGQLTLTAGALNKTGFSDPFALQMKGALQSNPVSFFLLASDSDSRRELIDPQEGMPGLVVRHKSGEAFNAYFDPQTLLLRKLVYRSIYGPEMTYLYENYKQVEGLQIAHRIESYRGSTKIEAMTITDFQVNAPLPENVFQKPDMSE